MDYIYDFHNSSNLFDFHLFADDSKLFCEDKNISQLENTELSNVYTWLCTNRLSLNIDKSNYVIFYHHKRIYKGLVWISKLMINS